MSLDITGLGSLFDTVGKVIDRVWPDPQKAAEMKLEIFKAEQAGQLQEMQAVWANAQQQLQVNAEEAKNENIFVSGWRPFIGWVCGIAMTYKFVILPLMLFVAAATEHPINLPSLDFTEMLTVLFAMLGLGGMRTAEKWKSASGAKPGG